MMVCTIEFDEGTIHVPTNKPGQLRGLDFWAGFSAVTSCYL